MKFRHASLEKTYGFASHQRALKRPKRGAAHNGASQTLSGEPPGPMSDIPTKRLARSDRDLLIAHYRRLSSKDRRLRFGGPLSDSALIGYVERIDFDRDAVYGVYAPDLTLSGAAHVAATGESAEFGVSVLDEYRGRGVGSALFERAGIWARNHGIRTLFMHCLSENAVMMHIATKFGMRIVNSSGEADAYLELAPSTASTVVAELIHDRVALFDHALKTWRAATQRLWGAA